MNRMALSALLLCAALCGCNNDDEEEENLPKLSQIEVSETLQSDVQSVSRVQTYNLTDGKLYSYVNTQRYSFALYGGDSETDELSQTTTASYANGTATLTDSYGNESVYTLNGRGYAESCIRNEAGGSVRSYSFNYVKQGGVYLLSSVTETIDGAQHSFIKIDYNSDSDIRITQTIGEESVGFVASIADAGEDNVCGLPFIFLAEAHPLSLHLAALYGGLLGRSYGKLIGSLVPVDNTYNESVSYSYSVNDATGYPTSCRIQTSSDGLSSVRSIAYKIN